MVEIIKVLKFKNEIFQIRDYVKVLLDNDVQIKGRINHFGPIQDTVSKQWSDHVHVGKYTIELSDIKNIWKIEETQEVSS